MGLWMAVVVCGGDWRGDSRGGSKKCPITQLLCCLLPARTASPCCWSSLSEADISVTGS